MSSDPEVLRAVLAEAARLAAGGGELDSRLGGLAGLTVPLAGAVACRIDLLDGSTGELIPAAAAGIDLPASSSETSRPPAANDPAMRVARTRRVEIGPVGEPGAWPGARVLAILPLVTSDPAGTEQVEGVLSASFADDTDPETVESLAAVAGFAAAAVRGARLERAVEERTDWFERVSHTDPLTGLANRRTFERMLELELARAARQGSALSLALFDVDGLAALSERHGADVGDDVLRRVASTLADSVRLVDTVARIGGDEFAVVAPGAAGRVVADRVVSGVAALEPIDGSERVQLSVGVAAFPADGSTAGDLLTAAEHALIQAKRDGQPAPQGAA